MILIVNYFGKYSKNDFEMQVFISIIFFLHFLFSFKIFLRKKNIFIHFDFFFLIYLKYDLIFFLLDIF